MTAISGLCGRAEARRALLRERGDALRELLGLSLRGLRVGLEIELRAQRRGRLRAQQALDRRHRQWRTAGKPSGERARRVGELTVVGELVDESPLVGARGIEALAEQQHLGRAREADPR